VLTVLLEERGFGKLLAGPVESWSDHDFDSAVGWSLAVIEGDDKAAQEFLQRGRETNYVNQTSGKDMSKYMTKTYQITKDPRFNLKNRSVRERVEIADHWVSTY
jgi:hypothetical protein